MFPKTKAQVGERCEHRPQNKLRSYCQFLQWRRYQVRAMLHPANLSGRHFPNEADPMNRKTRILIADNHQFVADACKKMLEPEFEVVGVASDGRALLNLALRLKPDGVILEVTLPHLNGIEAVRQLNQKLPTLRIIFLAANSDVNVVAEAFRVGASAYLLKRGGADEFVTAMRRVMRGESYLSPMIARETIDYL